MVFSFDWLGWIPFSAILFEGCGLVSLHFSRLQVAKPLNQVLSSLVDQEVSHQIEHDNLGSDDLHRTYTVDEFEVRILEPEKSGGSWETRATIPMQSSENALTVRMVTLFVSWQNIFFLLDRSESTLLNCYFLHFFVICTSKFSFNLTFPFRIPQQKKMKHFWPLERHMCKERMWLQEGVCCCFPLEKILIILKIW